MPLRISKAGEPKETVGGIDGRTGAPSSIHTIRGDNLLTSLSVAHRRAPTLDTVSKELVSSDGGTFFATKTYPAGYRVMGIVPDVMASSRPGMDVVVSFAIRMKVATARLIPFLAKPKVQVFLRI